MKQHFLGVDIGGTKSHCLIADENGEILGFGESGGGNWEMVGWDGLHGVLHECVQIALNEAKLSRSDISGAGFGIAGFDWPEDRKPIEQVIETLGFQAPYIADNDAILGLVAGTDKDYGVVVVSGTGSNSRGRNRDGMEGRVSGNGIEYGEYGGAWEIVAKAIQAISISWTQRGPKTKLSDTFTALTNANDVEDFLAGYVRGRYQITAEAARLIFQTAKDGDQVATDIIKWAGYELGDLAVGVVRQLGMEEEEFDVVLSGSTYNGSKTLIDSMKKRIQQDAPNARLVRLKSAPVVGGVLLGMKCAGHNISKIRPQLLKNGRNFRK